MILKRGMKGPGVKALQKALKEQGLEPGEVDGIYGSATEGAVEEYQLIHGLVIDGIAGPVTLKLLGLDNIAPTPAAPLNAYDFSTKAGTINAIRAECEKQGIGLPQQVAYVLATVEWETGGTFKPVREAYKRTEDWRSENLKYYPYYGRGFVQITWKENYALYGKKLNNDLVGNPDLALDPDVALFILVDGFKTGAFTGRKITDYINENKSDFINARRCINGTDRAGEIAMMARQYPGVK